MPALTMCGFRAVPSINSGLAPVFVMFRVEDATEIVLANFTVIGIFFSSMKFVIVTSFAAVAAAVAKAARESGVARI